MTSLLKSSDQPQPWSSMKIHSAKTARQGKAVSTSRGIKNMSPEEGTDDRGKRSGRCGKVEQKGVVGGKQSKRKKALSATALEAFLCIPETAVPDVEELRRKTEDDARACGRTVRSALPPSALRTGPATGRSDSTNKDREVVGGASLPSAVGPSSPKGVRNVTWTEADKENLDDQIQRAPLFTENATHKETLESSARPGKDPVHYARQEEVARGKSMVTNVSRKTVDDRVHCHSNSEEENWNESNINRGRSASSLREYSIEQPYRGREIQRRDSRIGVREEDQRRLRDWFLRSPWKNKGGHSRTSGSVSPRQTHSESHVHGQGSRPRRSDDEFEGYYEGSPVAYSRHEEFDYRTSRTYSPRGCQRLLRYDSYCTENVSRQRRCRIPERSRRYNRSCTPFSLTPPRRLSNSGKALDETQRVIPASTKDGDILGTPTALDRSQRRRRQASRESERTTRENVGKKAFYLTVDVEGKPYGPGRPAWIAAINKLARGLDPSCTHIRKQTFEDVQTFKDRLDEDFEYSRWLNEDYLRGLMGKAVTKRRGELLSFIRSGGEQPKHFDAEVWKRLEKLSCSTQQLEKSEQGRHANACRKTFGRTGSIGEDGVRQNLCKVLQRSPDPDKVQYEMLQDKGFGGRKRKFRGGSIKPDGNSSEHLMSDDGRRSPLHDDLAIELSRHAGYGEVQKRPILLRAVEDVVEDDDLGTVETTSVENGFFAAFRDTISKDEYILKLEAKIKRLEADDVNASTSDDCMQHQCSQSSQ